MGVLLHILPVYELVAVVGVILDVERAVKSVTAVGYAVEALVPVYAEVFHPGVVFAVGLAAAELHYGVKLAVCGIAGIVYLGGGRLIFLLEPVNFSLGFLAVRLILLFYLLSGKALALWNVGVVLHLLTMGLMLRHRLPPALYLPFNVLFRADPCSLAVVQLHVPAELGPRLIQKLLGKWLLPHPVD